MTGNFNIPIINSLLYSWSELNIFNYYSFKIYPRFWVDKITRIIHYNQPLLTKFGKNFVILNRWRQKLCHIEQMTSKWRQKCSPVTVIEPLTEETWGRGCVIFEWNGDNFSAFWFLIEQFKCQGQCKDWLRAWKGLLSTRSAFLLTVILPQTNQEPFVLTRGKDVKTQRRSCKNDSHNCN